MYGHLKIGMVITINGRMKRVQLCSLPCTSLEDGNVQFHEWKRENEMLSDMVYAYYEIAPISITG